MDAAGVNKDTPKGKALYREYLEWLSTDDAEQNRLGFDSLCRGWANGSDEFKREAAEALIAGGPRVVVEREAGELREAQWEDCLQRALLRIGKTNRDLVADRKSASWKVALADHLRKQKLASNAWLAKRLGMGTPNSVSSRVHEFRRKSGQQGKEWRWVKLLECVD